MDKEHAVCHDVGEVRASSWDSHLLYLVERQSLDGGTATLLSPCHCLFKKQSSVRGTNDSINTREQ